MGEGRGEGENTAISSSYVPLPFIPSHQGRGNPTFYEYNNLDGLVKNVTLALLSARKLDKDTSENLLHNMQSLKW